MKSVRIRSISQYSVRMRENTDQNNSEYGHFLPSGSEKLFQASDMERLHSRRWLRKLRGFYEIRKSKSPPYLFNLIPSSSKMHTARSSDNITPFKVRH